MGSPAFQDVVEPGRSLQARLPDLGLIAVGGTAAALHCGHRYSLDVDQVTVALQEQHEQVLETLAETCRGLGQEMAKRELSGALPTALEEPLLREGGRP